MFRAFVFTYTPSSGSLTQGLPVFKGDLCNNHKCTLALSSRATYGSQFAAR